MIFPPVVLHSDVSQWVELFSGAALESSFWYTGSNYDTIITRKKKKKSPIQQDWKAFQSTYKAAQL